MGKRCKVAECPLIKKTAEVPYAGSTRARIVACGESPGRQEEIDGKPFRGQAGKMLRTCCGKAGLEYLQLFLLNAARCRIIKQDLSTKEITAILKYCRPNVEAALKHIKPAAVVALGDFALRQLTRKAGITKARGRWSWSEEFDCWVMPTFHPAYILRNPSMEPYLVEDLRKVSEFVQNGYDVPGKQEGLVYQDVEDLRDWVKEGDLISIDTETQGLRWTEDSFVPIAVSLSRAQGVAFNLDLYEEVPEDQAEIVFPWMRQVGKVSQETLVGVRCCPNFEKRLDGLDWVLRNPKIPKYMMHGAFDMHVLRVLFQRAGREEVPIASYKMDVQAAANVFDENLFKMASLEQLQQFFSDFQENYNQEFEKTYGKADMLAVPQAERSLYACKDADATRRAAMSLREWLMQRPKLARYYAKMVHQSLTLSLYQLEKNGAWIDREELPKVTKVVKEAMEAAHTAALKVMPKSIVTNPFHVTKGFKLTRDDLVRDVLFSTEGFGLDPKRITASKQPSVDKNVRKELLEGRIAKRPREFLTHFNLWQELHTLWSRYLKGFARDVRQDGRIHSSYSLATAVTGRVASRDPNMMNNPKRSASAVLIRRLIAAPKGWVLLAADQSQCLTDESTLITIDGVRTFKEVREGRIPVLSVSDGWVPSFQEVLNSWSTGEKECLKLTFEDGSVEVCSLLHQFRRWDGGWVTADGLAVGDRLAHTWMTNSEDRRYYPEVGVSRGGHWKDGNPKWRIHRLVGEYLGGGSIPDGHEVHHRDGDKRNWARGNIVVRLVGDHKSHHARGENNANYGNLKGETKVCPICGTHFYRPPSRFHETTCSKRCSNLMFPRRPKGGNHKVVGIERIGDLPTYQIEVAVNHTYVMGSGLISKNSELRWAAHVARAKAMIKVFTDGRDIHENTARGMVSNWDKMTDQDRKEARRNAKPVNFGMLYLMTAQGLVDYAHMEYGVNMTEAQATKYIEAWFGTYPELRRYHQETIEFGRKHGYVESPLGRRRRLPELRSDDKWLRLGAERMAVNHPIQSPSSDVVLMACNEMLAQEVLPPDAAFPILFVHDELGFQVRDDSRVEDHARVIKQFMENPPLKRDFGFDLLVPLVSDVKVGPNLGNMEVLNL